MFSRILVPIDSGNTAHQGLKTAIALAKDQNALLLLLHVSDQRAPVYSSGMGLWMDSVITQIEDESKALLRKAEAEVRKAGLDSKSVLIRNLDQPVADVILKQSKRLRAQLIVIGTHGRSGVSRLVMGSEAEAVARGSDIPVLLVKSRRTPARRKAKRA